MPLEFMASFCKPSISGPVYVLDDSWDRVKMGSCTLHRSYISAKPEANGGNKGAVDISERATGKASYIASQHHTVPPIASTLLVFVRLHWSI